MRRSIPRPSKGLSYSTCASLFEHHEIIEAEYVRAGRRLLIPSQSQYSGPWRSNQPSYPRPCPVRVQVLGTSPFSFPSRQGSPEVARHFLSQKSALLGRSIQSHWTRRYSDQITGRCKNGAQGKHHVSCFCVPLPNETVYRKFPPRARTLTRSCTTAFA